MAGCRTTVAIKVLITCAGLLMGGPEARGGAPIRIASIFAQTGVGADDNALSIKGVREAVQEINARGGVLGRRLDLIEHDNLSTPIGSKLAAEEAVKERVTAIIGAAWSSHTLAMAPIAQASRTPLITTISTHDQITQVGDCVFRMCFSDSFQGRVMADFAKEVLHARTAVTVVNLTSDYSVGLAREFELDFTRAGGRIIRQLSYRVNQATFTDLAFDVKAAAPDVVFIPGYWESAVIIKAILGAGSTAIPLGGDGWGTERFFQLGGKDILRAYYSTHWAEDFDSPRSRAFVKKYKHGPWAMDPQEALAYDAVYLLADAIQRARYSGREKVRDALAATSGFTGVTGTISFTQQREQNRSAVIMKFVDGKVQYYKTFKP
jgi:branched-chain amino acid transport system substrate-binding protein